MENQVGIIIKTLFPKKRKMILFDQSLGKIEAVPPHEQFSCGTLLSYQVSQKGFCYFLYDTHIIDIPFALAREDILFLHHALEVCYYYAPFASVAPEAFHLMVYLYNDFKQLHSWDFKIIFLFKLLMVLGIHPEEPQFQDASYYILGRESIDTIMNKSIHLNTKKIIYEWVCSCIAMHPLSRIFKTAHFLDKNRLI